jgi:nucleotide-binding universal stress UspA family protein
MFHHAIVGIDGRDGGRDAHALACALGARELTLVAAYPVDPVPTRGTLTAFEHELRDEALQQLRAAEVEADGDVRVHAHAVGDASPARALQRAAVDVAADLIVVGSSHRGVAGRLLLGDVSTAVLHDAPCHVAVAPHSYRRQARRARTVVAGFDGSAEALEAVDVAARLRDELGGQLILVEAVRPPVGWSPPGAPMIDWRSIAEEQRVVAGRELREALDRIGGDAELRVDIGDAGSVLVSVAQDNDADVLVVGSRGWGPLRRIVLGSTSNHVIHHARCPVIVVPRPAAPFRAVRSAA